MDKVQEVDFVQDESTNEELQVHDLGEIDYIPKYHEDYHYYIIYDKRQNNKVSSLIGLQHPVESIDYNPDTQGTAEITITENQYDIIKISITAKDLMVFYTPDTGELFYRRLFIEITKGEYNPKYNAITSDDNIIRMKIHALDSNEDTDDDIKEIHLKRLRSGGDAAPVNPIVWQSISYDDDGNEVLTEIDGRKAILTNGQEVQFDLTESESFRTIIRSKAFIPGVTDWWLSVYPELKKI